MFTHERIHPQRGDSPASHSLCSPQSRVLHPLFWLSIAVAALAFLLLSLASDGESMDNQTDQARTIPSLAKSSYTAASSIVPVARRGAVSRSLRTGQSLRIAGLALRLVRVNGQTCSLIVRTSSQSASYALQEFDSVFIENYEIIVDDIRPSSRGRGSATLTIRYLYR